MGNNFEWVRIAFAMGLMSLGFIVLPAYFLGKDRHADERAAAAVEAARIEQEAGADR